ncbi:ABC transporter permease [Candidatus Riflebacteria bacterium]
MFNLRFRTILLREIWRFWVVKIQTLLAPVVTSMLYLFIFGYSLGRRITPFHGVPYLKFIIPGLIMMGIINHAYQNSASSLMISKYEKNIMDILIAPFAYYEITLAYIFAAVFRGLLVGFVIYCTSLTFIIIIPVHPIYAIIICFLAASVFAEIGIIAGIWAEKWENIAPINIFIILPFTYLGGVFYSLSILPDFWQKISHFNPLLYMIDGFRYGMLGVCDVNPVISMTFVFLTSFSLFLVCLKIFASGWKLRT